MDLENSSACAICAYSSPSIARSAVIIPAKCLHDKGEGELREGVRVDGRSLDESRHKLCQLMKSLLAKNGAEIYVLGKLCAKAWRFIYNSVPCSPLFFLSRARMHAQMRYLRIFPTPLAGKCVRAHGVLLDFRAAWSAVDRYRGRERIVYVCSHILCWHKKA
jgi:hypothetical protein